MNRFYLGAVTAILGVAVGFGVAAENQQKWGGTAINTVGIPGNGNWQERPFRLPDVDPKTYTPEQKAAVEAMIRDFGVKQLSGPHRLFIADPRVFKGVSELIVAENNAIALDKRLVRLVAIMWSKKWNAQFEWFVQASLAKRDGLQPEVIEAIRAGQKPKFTKPDEQLVYDALTELFSNNAISDATFTSLHNTLGYAATADFINFSGIFNMAGMVINMLDMKAPAPFPADPVPH